MSYHGIDLLSDVNTERGTGYFNDKKSGHREAISVIQMFEEQVNRTPDVSAIIFGNRIITYQQFNHKVNHLAHFLRRKGIGPGAIVAVMTERSFEMVQGIFGVLKAGGAYLPIDPFNPMERTRQMLADCQARILLTQQKFIKYIEGYAEAVINLEDPNIDFNSGFNPDVVNKPSDIVYVIYTSGSTGLPRGVMIEHVSLVNRLNWMQKKYPLDVNDIILQKTPFFFDVSVWEIIWWSLVGATVSLMAPRMEKFPQAIVEAVEAYNITILHFVPSMMSVFLDYIENAAEIERLSTLKRVFVSGETLKPTHVKQFNETLYQRNSTLLSNLYGPTEATVDVTYFDCPPGKNLEKIPIGKPIDNIDIFILDNEGHFSPEGTPGELCITGIGTARGYLNRPYLTDKKFVNNPFSSLFSSFQEPYPASTYKMYKTGDVARLLPDGNIEFIGRMDNQIKIRGLRIELGEIEVILSNHPSIQDCAVLVKKVTETIINIIACIVSEYRLSNGDVKNYLKLFLPDYMIPNEFIILDALPLASNGKIDRKVLLKKISSK